MRKYGFTLAEVLITLVIIGVIAAMTVPTLMNNTNSQEYRSALKKAISALNQAVTMHYALEGALVNDEHSTDGVVGNIFAARLNVINSGTVTTANWAGTGDGACSGTVFITADGIAYCVNTFEDGACNSDGTTSCGEILIDVNGMKKPNKLTENGTQPKDIYKAQLFAQRVIPLDEPTQQVMYDAGLN